jgi:hypothetical protein
MRSVIKERDDTFVRMLRRIEELEAKLAQVLSFNSAEALLKG